MTISYFFVVLASPYLLIAADFARKKKYIRKPFSSGFI